MPSSTNGPCAACKVMRRKCTNECEFAQYFPPEQTQKFLILHRTYGANNVSKILKELSPEYRKEAVNSLAYEAEARIHNPVYGCVGSISILQQNLKQVKAALHIAKSELATYIGPSAVSLLMSQMAPQKSAQLVIREPQAQAQAQQQQQELAKRLAMEQKRWQQYQLQQQQLLQAQAHVHQIQVQARAHQIQAQAQAQALAQYFEAQQLAAVRERQQQQQEFVMKIAMEQKMLQQQQQLQLQQQQPQQQQMMMNQYHLQPEAQDLLRFDKGVESSVGSSNAYNQCFGNETPMGSSLALGSGYDNNNNNNSGLALGGGHDNNNNSGLALGRGYDNNNNSYQRQPQQAEHNQHQQEFVMRIAMEQKMLQQQQQQLLQVQQQQPQQQQQMMMNQYHLQPEAQDLLRFDQGVEGSVVSNNGYNQYFGNGTPMGSGLALESGYDNNNNSGLALGSGYDHSNNSYQHQHQPQQPQQPELHQYSNYHQHQFHDEEQLSLQTPVQQSFFQLATQPQLYEFDDDEDRPGFGLSG